MKISIRHHTTYRYDRPVYFGVQRLHLRAASNAAQDVIRWTLDLDGASEQLSYRDVFGNSTDLIKLSANTESVSIAVDGLVHTHDHAGVFGHDPNPLPDWFYTTTWKFTEPGSRSRRLAARYSRQLQAAVAGADRSQRSGSNKDELAVLHELMLDIREMVGYEVGGTQVDTTAEEALQVGKGVCQDHAHIMISVARQMGYPARYVSGYLLMDDVIDQAASHAWCEVLLGSLGWVGFDVSNGISPDERYVRLAVGRDYGDVPPVHGIRYGVANEVLDVQLQVQQ